MNSQIELNCIFAGTPPNIFLTKTKRDSSESLLLTPTYPNINIMKNLLLAGFTLISSSFATATSAKAEFAGV
jgi:hypothetical protein